MLQEKSRDPIKPITNKMMQRIMSSDEDIFSVTKSNTRASDDHFSIDRSRCRMNSKTTKSQAGILSNDSRPPKGHSKLNQVNNKILLQDNSSSMMRP